MSGAFDPYHRWLGIPSKDQPANHYRLLGIDLFESDPEVIRDAAERQMTHVRGYALGEYTELSQRILNELATAKACLLDPEKKTAYDTSFKGPAKPRAKPTASPDDIYALATSPPVGAADVPQPPPVGNVSRDMKGSSLGKRISSAEDRTKLPARKLPSDARWKLLTGLAGVAGALLLVMGANWLWNSSMTLTDRQSSPSSDRPPSVARMDHGPEAPDSPAVRPPKLAAGASRPLSTNQGMTIQFQVRLADRGTAKGNLRFSLDADTPNGATIDPNTGLFTWMPGEQQPPGKYPVTVQVVDEGQKNLGDRTTFWVRVEPAVKRMQDNQTFTTVVHPPTAVSGVPGNVPAAAPGTPAYVPPQGLIAGPSWNGSGHNQLRSGYGPLSNRMQPFEIKFPLGKTLSSATFDVRNVVRRETDALLSKCRGNNPDVIGFFQEGSNSAIASMSNIKGNKPHGTAVIFHPGADFDGPKPKQFINYQNGKWDGVLATWNAAGQKEFWCNYSNGQRHGFCCLFSQDVLAAVLECNHNSIEAVHLIANNQVKKTLTDADQARADEAFAPLLKQIETIEQDLKSDDREFRDRVKQGIQMRIGAINSKKREAFGARSASRAAAQEQTIQNLRRAGGS